MAKMRKPVVSRKQMNIAIHEFIGGKWALVHLNQGGHFQVITQKYNTFEKAVKECKAYNKIQSVKYTVRPDKIADYEFHYHSSWEALMPVVKKIIKLNLKPWADAIFITESDHYVQAIVNAAGNAMRKESFIAVYQFIAWYGKQLNS